MDIFIAKIITNDFGREVKVFRYNTQMEVKRHLHTFSYDLMEVFDAKPGHYKYDVGTAIADYYSHLTGRVPEHRIIYV